MTCSKCLDSTLTENNFYFKKSQNTLSTICKKCVCKATSIWKENNPDKVKLQILRKYELEKRRRIENKQPRKKRIYVISEQEEKRREEIKINKDFLRKERLEKLYLKKIERIKIIGEIKFKRDLKKKWKNKIKQEKIRIKKSDKKDISQEKKKISYFKSLERNRERNRYCMKVKIRSIIRKSLKNNGFTKNSKSFEILGCEYEIFKKHIERQFKDGMSWNNHGLYGWHYDHIMPLSTAKTYEDIVRLNHYTNFRPLWASDNLFKSDSIIEHQLKLNI